MSTKREREKAKADFDSDLAANIRLKREESGLTQQALASKVHGWTQGKVWKYESQFARPTVYNLAQLAKALGCSVTDLLPKV